MTTLLLTILYGAIVTIAGLGVVAPLARHKPVWVVGAPAAGMGLLAALGTGVSPLLPMHTTAWAVFLPVTLTSGLVGVILLRGTPLPKRHLVFPVGLYLGAMVLASLPNIIRGTSGPIAFQVYDSLGYSATDLWLKSNPVTSSTIEGQDLLTRAGTFYVAGNQRIGVSALNAAVSSGLGVSPSVMLTPLLGIALGGLALGCWLLATRLGAGVIGGAVAGLWGLSPSAYMLVADTTLANLFALALVPVLVAALLDGQRLPWRAVPTAGAVLAGLLATYPELGPPTAALLGVCGLVYFIGLARGNAWGRSTWRRAASFGAQAIAVGVCAIAVTPEGTRRAIGYVREIATASIAERFSDLSGAANLFDTLPPRWLTPINGGPWLFGSVHLYELQRWDAASALIRIGFPLLALTLFALIITGVVRRGPAAPTVVLGGIGVASIVAYGAFTQYGSNGCQYCAWKSLTFAIPFVAAGLGLGASRVYQWARTPKPRAKRLAGIAGLTAVGCGLLLASTANARLARGLINSPSAVSPELRQGTAEATAGGQRGEPVALEGLEGRPHPFYELGMGYFLTAARSTRPPTFIAVDGGVPYITPATPRAADYFDSTYRTVLTAFPKLRTTRARIWAMGGFAVERPRAIDALIAGQAARSFGNEPGLWGIPWLTGPIEVWVRNPGTTAATLRIETTGRAADPSVPSTVTLEGLGGRPIPIVRYGPSGRHLCAALGPAVLRRVRVTPVGTAPAVPGRATESDPVADPPRRFGITALLASDQPCPKPSGFRLDQEITTFGPGWSGPEPGGPDGTAFRWMTGRRATLSAGEFGAGARTRQVTIAAEAFLRDRSVSVLLNNRLLRRISVGAGAWSTHRLDLPAASEPATITLVPNPGPQPISPDGAGDPRSVSIRVAVLAR